MSVNNDEMLLYMLVYYLSDAMNGFVLRMNSNVLELL